ncbi:unnamed protein product [marine sediment metagenome]|uniref:Uncharacterized protein n=1 Tax=marine sediment metagenome TaxID=412755 RepID=X0T2M6_9ZZZZ
MKYKEMKEGPNKGLWEDENRVAYTPSVAKKRMANPELYDPEPPKKAKKK